MRNENEKAEQNKRDNERRKEKSEAKDNQDSNAEPGKQGKARNNRLAKVKENEVAKRKLWRSLLLIDPGASCASKLVSFLQLSCATRPIQTLSTLRSAAFSSRQDLLIFFRAG
jgi:ATPase subunit of ABC transporter with duplicated ATPase domains